MTDQISSIKYFKKIENLTKKGLKLEYKLLIKMSQKESDFTSDPSGPSDETAPAMDWSEESKKKSIVDFDYQEFETMVNEKKVGDLNLEEKLKASLCQAEKEGDNFASIGLKRILKHLGGEDTKPNYKDKMNSSFDPKYKASKMLDSQQENYMDHTKGKHFDQGFPPKKNFNPKFNSGGPGQYNHAGRGGGLNFNNNNDSNFNNFSSRGRGGGRGRGGPHGSGGRGGNFRGKYPPTNNYYQSTNH